MISNLHLCLLPVLLICLYLSYIPRQLEVKDCVQMIIADNAISAAEITCESLKPKIEGLYASFYVAVRVDSVIMSHAIEVLMNADYWPKGVFIKRYFKPKNGNSQ